MMKYELINITENFIKDVARLKDNKKLTVKQKYKIRLLIKALNNLYPLDYQKIIMYRYFENMRYKDIGRYLNIDYSTVKRKLNKAILNTGRLMFGFEDEFLS